MNHDFFNSCFYTQIAQSNPNNTSTNALYTLTASKQIYVTSILVANVSGSDTTYSIFHDIDGNTFSADTALAYNVSLPAGSAVSMEYENPLPLVSVGSGIYGSFGVQSGNSGAVTYTLYGFIRNVQ